jgi:hypothetical protein
LSMFGSEIYLKKIYVDFGGRLVCCCKNQSIKIYHKYP